MLSQLQITYLFVHLLGLASLTLLFVDDGEVEHGSGALLLSDRNLEMVDGLECVFLVGRRIGVVQDTKIEVCFEVLGVDLELGQQKSNGLTSKARWYRSWHSVK